MKKRLNKNKGILFWITGLSGSGKSTVGETIHKKIIKKFGPTLLIHGNADPVVPFEALSIAEITLKKLLF